MARFLWLNSELRSGIFKARIVKQLQVSFDPTLHYMDGQNAVALVSIRL